MPHMWTVWPKTLAQYYLSLNLNAKVDNAEVYFNNHIFQQGFGILNFLP